MRLIAQKITRDRVTRRADSTETVLTEYAVWIVDTETGQQKEVVFDHDPTEAEIDAAFPDTKVAVGSDDIERLGRKWRLLKDLRVEAESRGQTAAATKLQTKEDAAWTKAKQAVMDKG